MEIADMLKQTPLLAEMSDAHIAELAPSTRLETYRPGHMILREGHAGGAFFMILSGKVEVVKGSLGGEPEVLATLVPGEFFGEVAVMKHVSRSASVRALEETECLVIRRLDLDFYFEQYPVIAAKMATAHAAKFGR
jgi:CRP-like cAMP-binding protein